MAVEDLAASRGQQSMSTHPSLPSSLKISEGVQATRHPSSSRTSGRLFSWLKSPTMPDSKATDRRPPGLPTSPVTSARTELSWARSTIP